MKSKTISKPEGSCAAEPVLLDDVDFSQNLPNDDPFSKELLQYPPGKNATTVITKGDLVRLAPDCYLNDSLIDFYCSFIFEKISNEKSKILVFSSFFYQHLKILAESFNDMNKSKENWSKKAKILEKSHLIIPINEDYHWSLLIVSNFDKAVSAALNNSSETSKIATIFHLDSFKGSHDRKYICEILREYLSCLLKNNSKKEIDSNFRFDEKNFPDKNIKVPQQKNFCDCGLYLLNFVSLYINSIFETGNNVTRNVKFDKKEIDQMRQKIYYLILELAGKKAMSYEKFGEKYKNYFNENIEINDFRQNSSKKIRLKIKEIGDIDQIRDAILTKKSNLKKSESLKDFMFNLIVTKKESTKNRYNLTLNYEQAEKIGALKKIIKFFKQKLWKCQKCGRSNSFRNRFCQQCDVEKTNLKDIIAKLKTKNDYSLEKALLLFFGK